MSNELKPARTSIESTEKTEKTEMSSPFPLFPAVQNLSLADSDMPTLILSNS
jgi:hypothetical protein